MLTKNRLETFTDGVIAIIITIMVLSIPLPETSNWNDLIGFSSSLFIYLLSFLVVGAFWNLHHKTFNYLNRINQKIIAANIFFLFFLSLIPLFTKWVIQNQGILIPVIGYDVVYLLVSFFHVLIFRLVMSESEHEEIIHIKEKLKSSHTSKPRSSWLPIILLLIVISVMVVMSIYLPKISTIILMGIPIASSILNLFITERKPGGRRFTKTEKDKD
ncbi:MAG TPA: TMEM175 family protein [Ignavibacteriaceae bacterium]|nr:TMEM175 family protein [Ignavibacteriaceae bacterium]